MKTLIAALSLFVVFSQMPRFASAEQVYRIMPVGDSITAGYTDNPNWTIPFSFGYRSGLYDRLTTSHNQGSYGFQFVGGATEPFAGPYPPPPPTVAGVDLRTVDQDHHEGFGGVGTAFVEANINTWLTTYNPHVILLMIGINDIGLGSNAAPTYSETHLASAVQEIVTNAPNTHVIVAQITPYYGYTDSIVQYNDYIKNTLVPDFASAGKSVTTVDLYSIFLTPGGAIDTSLFASINHPNNVGYGRMAQAWLDGIQALNLPVVSVPEPSSMVLLAFGCVAMLACYIRKCCVRP